MSSEGNSGCANAVFLKPDCAIGVNEGLSVTEISSLDLIQKKMTELAVILTSTSEKEDDLITIIKHAIDTNLLLKLLSCLPVVTFNTRQEVANVFCAILSKPTALIKNLNLSLNLNLAQSQRRDRKSVV